MMSRGKMSLERSILEKLKDSKNNYYNAISNLPRNMRMMYVHSFQSVIWNRIVSTRLQKYGFDVIPGDFILLPSSDNTNNNITIGDDHPLSSSGGGSDHATPSSTTDAEVGDNNDDDVGDDDDDIVRS